MDNNSGFMKKNPINVNAMSIATFIPTIRVSDFPTALGPMKLIKVNITMIKMANTSTPIL